MLADHLFENVPHDGILLFHHFLGSFDRCAMPSLFQPVIDEGFEQFERHPLGETALMQLQFRADHDHGTSGVVDALSEKILAESSLLAFQAYRTEI